MPQENIETKDIFMDAMLNKYELQLEYMRALQKQISGIGETTNALFKTVREMEPGMNGVPELRVMVNKLHFPTRQLEQLTEKLVENMQQLQQPVATTVTHQHQIPKVIWATAGVFLLFCLACSGWYMAASDGRQYRASDTKYRQLKLVSDRALQQYLVRLDSVYVSDPDKMREAVTEQERLIQQRVELIERVQAVDIRLQQQQVEEKK